MMLPSVLILYVLIVIILLSVSLSEWYKGEEESIGLQPEAEVQPYGAHPILQRPACDKILLWWGWAWECQESE